MVSICVRIVNSSLFKKFIITIIFLAAIIIGLETNSNIVASHGRLLNILDQSILAIFVVEILFKLVAESPKPWNFFLDPWNFFDLAIVVICLLPLDSEFAAVLRITRVLRVLRLVTALPKLQILVGALLKSIPSMGYVALLLSVLFYIYGVMGVFFFSKADPLHFGGLGTSILTLFGVITLEGWTTLMYDLLRGNSDVSSIKVIIYFISFVLFGTMIMLNLFIGVIMNSMQEVHQEQTEAQLKSESKTNAAELQSIEMDLEALKARLRATREKL